ncbi:MAG: NfeD family protein [Vicinamibacterales bacterium]
MQITRRTSSRRDITVTWCRRLRLCVTAVVLVVAAGLTSARVVSDDRATVYVIPIDGVIDLGLAPYVERTLAEAAAQQAAAVLLDINTFGGRVDAAVLIRDALLRTPVRTIAFVNKRAISAGALISLAATSIVMAEGGTLGAATPVAVGAPGGGAQPVEEKTVSYMRKEFRATAEARKRPPLLAEAMVDADVEVPGISEKGKLLTLTTDEALQHGVADARADTLEAALAAVDLRGAEVRRIPQTWAETLVRILTHPVLSSILLAIGMLGLIIEVQTPGVGLPGGVGLICLGLFFWGHWLVALAGWEELLLMGTGVVLLVVEIFVTPGFGLAGLLGIGALLGGLGLSVVGAGATWEVMLRAGGRVAASLLLAVVGAAVMLRALPRLPFGRRLVLEEELTAQAGYASPPESDRRWVGKHGTTLTPLRPAGIAEFDGERVDVVSEGVFLEAGQPIHVLRVDGNRIVVRSGASQGTGGSHDGT